MKPALPDNDLLFVIVTSVYNVYILGLETLFSVYICFFSVNFARFWLELKPVLYQSCGTILHAAFLLDPYVLGLAVKRKMN